MHFYASVFFVFRANPLQDLTTNCVCLNPSEDTRQKRGCLILDDDWFNVLWTLLNCPFQNLSDLEPAEAERILNDIRVQKKRIRKQEIHGLPDNPTKS